MVISPDIVAEEILPRLPVKSLLKFRCVCKSWCLLISEDKYFIKSHLKNSSKNSGVVIASFNHRPIGHVERKQNSSLVQSSCATSICFDDFTIINNGYTNDQSQAYVNLVGSCNGLCCIRKGKQLFIWNPATKSSYMLPDLVPLLNTQISTNSPTTTIKIIAGFGFNESNDDYKVLSVITCSFGCRRTVVALLYSSRTNSWKVVKNFGNTTAFSYSHMKFLNGNLHLLESDWSFRITNIYSFDLEKEVFGLVQQPPNCGHELESAELISIGILDGYLSYTRKWGSPHKCRRETEVWIMKSYGVKESWHLLNTITTSFVEYTPFCLAKDGGMLFYHEHGLMIYDPKTQVCRRSEWGEVGNVCAHIYVESLVTPVPAGALTTQSN